MKILWISEAGYSSDLALTCVMQGHQVKLWIKDPKYKHIYDGILNKTDDWSKEVYWCDLVFFDHTGMSGIWKEIYKKKPCFGGSEWADKLEKDRLYAHKIFEQVGLKGFESIRCKSFQEAIDHVKKHKVRHVVKPVGKNVDSHHVIISEDESGEDAVALMESFGSLQVDYIEIEEKKDGIEVGLDGYFSGDWIGDIFVNFEHKRYASGHPEGIGPLTGEMGNCGLYQSKDNPFFKKTLDKLKPLLIENNYRGQINLCFIVDKKGTAYPLEAGPRIGYPGCYVQSPLQITPLPELFYNVAVGNQIQNETSQDWSLGVVVLMPGFPEIESAKKLSDQVPVINLKYQYPNTVHLCEVKYDKRIVTAPGQGYPMVVTGTGSTLQQAKSNAYRILSTSNSKRVRVPNSFWRIDIGDRVIRQMEDIYKLGIIEPKLEMSLLMEE